MATLVRRSTCGIARHQVSRPGFTRICTLYAIATPTPPAKAVTKLPTLTSLRAIAAFVVFCRHAMPAFLGTTWLTHHLFDQGGEAVSFFFILSGFVLTWSHRSNDSKRSFWRRRAARIAPLHIVTWFTALGVLSWIGTRPAWSTVLIGLPLLQSFIPRSRIYYGNNTVAWSLSCEAFFYLVFPFVFALLVHRSPRQRRTLLALLIVLMFAIPLAERLGGLATATEEWLTIIFPPVRLIEFLIGILVALEVKDGSRLRVGVTKCTWLALGSYLLSSFLPIPIQYTCITVIPFSLVIAAAATADLSDGGGWLTRPFMVYLGVISFAFYLLHLVVIQTLNHVLAFPPPITTRPLLVLVALLLATVLSVIAHEALEAPLERRWRSGAPQGAV